MNFTSQPPTEPGAYWWKDKHRTGVCEMVIHNGKLFTVIGNKEYDCDSKDVEWCRLVPLDEYVEKGEVEKAWTEGFHHLTEWEHSEAKALLDGKEKQL